MLVTLKARATVTSRIGWGWRFCPPGSFSWLLIDLSSSLATGWSLSSVSTWVTRECSSQHGSWLSSEQGDSRTSGEVEEKRVLRFLHPASLSRKEMFVTELFLGVILGDTELTLTTYPDKPSKRYTKPHRETILVETPLLLLPPLHLWSREQRIGAHHSVQEGQPLHTVSFMQHPRPSPTI